MAIPTAGLGGRYIVRIMGYLVVRLSPVQHGHRSGEGCSSPFTGLVAYHVSPLPIASYGAPIAASRGDRIPPKSTDCTQNAKKCQKIQLFQTTPIPPNRLLLLGLQQKPPTVATNQVSIHDVFQASFGGHIFVLTQCFLLAFAHTCRHSL